MYFQSIKEGFLKPFPKQNTHKQSYLSQATNAHDLTQPQPASRQMPSWSCCQRSKLRESGAYVKELLKETVSPLKFQRPGPLKDPSGNLHASGALASTAWSLQIRDHGGDRTFDKGPSFGGRLKLPQAQVLVRDVLEKRSLCKVRQCYKTMVRSGFPRLKNNINAAKLLPSACLHPILETRTLCAVLWIFRECSLRPRAVPFRRRWPGCAYTGGARSAALATSGPWRQTTPELGSPGTVALRRLPLQLAGSYPGGFLERNFETLLSECTKKGLSHTKVFLAATCWELAPHKSTDRSSTHVSAVATAFLVKHIDRSRL